MPTIAEIAKDVMDLCLQGKNVEAIDKHYSKDIMSVESSGGPEMPAEMKGIEAVRQKNKWWIDNNEVHEAKIDGPYVGTDGFALVFEYDFTNKPSGKHFHLKEVGLYKVSGEKIVHEHFFYNPGS